MHYNHVNFHRTLREEQKELQKQKNEPVNKWQKKQEEEIAKKAGWNKLKSNY